jgi:hypothetical protein
LRWLIAVAGCTLLAPTAAEQDVALKDLMPKRRDFPLLWDCQRQPKPAFNAVVDVLRSAK